MTSEATDERTHRNELQKARRLANRTCGYCDEQAATMLPWGKQQIGICHSCQSKLAGAASPEPCCAFDEVHPLDLRPQPIPGPILVEARLLPAPELITEPPRRSLVGRLIRSAGRIFHTQKRPQYPHGLLWRSRLKALHSISQDRAPHAHLNP